MNDSKLDDQVIISCISLLLSLGQFKNINEIGQNRPFLIKLFDIGVSETCLRIMEDRVSRQGTHNWLLYDQILKIMILMCEYEVQIKLFRESKVLF